MFRKVLIANRGEITARIIRTLKKCSITSVVIYSHADRLCDYVAQADEAYALGAGDVADTYLSIDKILGIAKQCGAQAIIPGYGFLSENAEFAEACEAEGICFVGPTPTQIRQFGLKHRSRELCAEVGVPLVPGSELLNNLEDALQAAKSIGYPVMLKSTAGGGGIGLTRCDDAQTLSDTFEHNRRLSHKFFKNNNVFVEQFVDRVRHIEVQIFGDGNGNVIALGERDCSLQRRDQKIVEETPAPYLSEATRTALHQAAVTLGKAVNYRSAGTVEYIYDTVNDRFYFLEVNTRLQVEHTVTEEVTGLDLVEWMLLIAAGTPPAGLLNSTPYTPGGNAIEVRIYAEDPLNDFQPSPGELTKVSFPRGDDVRVDTWISSGTDVSPFYDPLLAKVIVKADSRQDALTKMSTVLNTTVLAGITTNLDYLRQVINYVPYITKQLSTRALEGFTYRANSISVLQPGTYTSLQDYPGRTGYWDIGVSPSGPMDNLAFRLANRAVGNHPSAAALECTLIGPVLKFNCDAVVALTGALSTAQVDGKRIPAWKPLAVKAGETLDVGKTLNGCRTYLAIRGGFDAPEYLGSRSTFALGQFGGHGGRILRQADLLPVSQSHVAACTTPAPQYAAAAIPPALIPKYPQPTNGHGAHWEIGVMHGPHSAPDFFTKTSIALFLRSDWEVHYNSNRLGIRLNGPKLEFTRNDGGEAGLHPSNIHDCAYAIGSVNFTGDLPVILTCDGPSLGGFVCPVTIVQSELWKVGQVKPGDTIRFKVVTVDWAHTQTKAINHDIHTLQSLAPTSGFPLSKKGGETSSVLAQRDAAGDIPAMVCRQAGDSYILLEYGDEVLDIGCRFRVHALMEALTQAAIQGLEELVPGVRSLQIRYDNQVITQRALMAHLQSIERELPSPDNMGVQTRVIHLPMAFEDSATLDAVDKYRQSVRDQAPWLPNNVDFIQRINGLEKRENVRDIIYSARYLVLGLGDVYLGAPCAVPVDPRHRLLTSKYNPARTFTAEGTVGIGGQYMCIYGMDSPGGYQLVGRTLPIWNKYLTNPQFKNDKPWLLRFFDQVCFYPVSESELLEQREAFRHGRSAIRIEEEYFSLADYRRFLSENTDSIAAFKSRQQAAFTKEVAHWRDEESAQASEAHRAAGNDAKAEFSGLPVRAEISGNLWKLMVEAGQQVKQGETLLIIEAMKMEFPLLAPSDGTVEAVSCKAGHQVLPGEALLHITSQPATSPTQPVPPPISETN